MLLFTLLTSLEATICVCKIPRLSAKRVQKLCKNTVAFPVRSYRLRTSFRPKRSKELSSIVPENSILASTWRVRTFRFLSSIIEKGTRGLRRPQSPDCHQREFRRGKLKHRALACFPILFSLLDSSFRRLTTIAAIFLRILPYLSSLTVLAF